MAPKKKAGLGKGLDALFIDNSIEENGDKLVNINDIEPNRDQPRKFFDDEALKELSDSIAIMKDGKLLTCDTPDAIKLSTGEISIENAFIKIVRGAAK